MRRALLVGAIPALLLALGAGALLSWRELRRVRMVHRSVARILQGDLSERLAARNPADDFDRLAMAVNRMLEEIERLLEEVRGVGDNIAHDLRTPLTRVRARLERIRDTPRSEAELEDAIDIAVAGLDQTLGIITALLRIAEIEDGNRRAAFGDIDLALIVQRRRGTLWPDRRKRRHRIGGDSRAATGQGRPRPSVRGGRERAGQCDQIRAQQTAASILP